MEPLVGDVACELEGQRGPACASRASFQLIAFRYSSALFLDVLCIYKGSESYLVALFETLFLDIPKPYTRNATRPPMPHVPHSHNGHKPNPEPPNPRRRPRVLFFHGQQTEILNSQASRSLRHLHSPRGAPAGNSRKCWSHSCHKESRAVPFPGKFRPQMFSSQ